MTNEINSKTSLQQKCKEKHSKQTKEKSEKNMIVIKILRGHKNLINRVLELVEVSEGLYKCKKSGIEIVDAWGELSFLKEWSVEYNEKTFCDIHLFSCRKNELEFIDEIELVK
jgi:hypothetical protein